MRLIVYTAAIGETDAVQAPVVVDPRVRYLCFTDRPCPAPYERVDVPTAADGTPASRVYKVRADHPALQEAEATVWHDASYRLLTDLTWAIAALETADVGAMQHPRRHRIEDEAVAIARYGYVTKARALELVAEYRAAGFTEDRLSSAGLLARRVSPTTTRVNTIWWTEVQRWNCRDQASFDYAVWAAQAAIGSLPGTVRDNAFATWRGKAAA